MMTNKSTVKNILRYSVYLIFQLSILSCDGLMVEKEETGSKSPFQGSWVISEVQVFENDKLLTTVNASELYGSLFYCVQKEKDNIGKDYYSEYDYFIYSLISIDIIDDKHVNIDYHDDGGTNLCQILQIDNNTLSFKYGEFGAESFTYNNGKIYMKEKYYILKNLYAVGFTKEYYDFDGTSCPHGVRKKKRKTHTCTLTSVFSKTTNVKK